MTIIWWQFVKKRVTLTLNKSAYAGICILVLSRILMYEFHYDYIKNKYGNNSRLLFTNTDRLIHEIKTGDVYEDFSKDKEIFDFNNHSTGAKYYSNKLVVGKMKDEIGGVDNKEFVGLKFRIYSFLVDDSSDYKKAKDVNKNVVPTTSHYENKVVLLNKKCLRHSMNRIQSKYHRIGTYEINKISLLCFDDKIYIQNNRYDGLVLDYQS